MQRLVEDLLAYATFTARPVLGPVALPAVVREVRLDLLPELSRAGADVAYSGPDEVVGDPTLLRQLLQNLVGNAVTHARPGVPPRVVVRAGVTGASWWLEVDDNGPGIPADQRERVLDPLVRLTGPDGPAGSGIGLATCARIAEALGGTIAVDAAPGGGTAVRVTLPVPRPAGAAGPDPTGPWYG
jgi:signal transduction histidine kinase